MSGDAVICYAVLHEQGGPRSSPLRGVAVAPVALDVSWLARRRVKSACASPSFSPVVAACRRVLNAVLLLLLLLPLRLLPPPPPPPLPLNFSIQRRAQRGLQARSKIRSHQLWHEH